VAITFTTLENSQEQQEPDKNNNVVASKSTENHAVSLWNNFLDLLSDNLKKSEINTWFSVITPKSFENNVLTIIVPSKDYYSIIERRFNKQIGKIIESGLLGENGRLNYEVLQDSLFDEKEEQGNNEPVSRMFDISKPQANFIKPVVSNFREQGYESNLKNKFTFNTFVEGENNKVAVAAAYAISNNPGKLYNPFFIYGGVGLGKTHLVHAVGNEIIRKNPSKKVYYTTAPDFTTQFTTSMAHGKIGFTDDKTGIKELDAFYKSLDVLIVDDIQYLAGKPGTQDFMYQIFNTLHSNNKHIIFSCDKPLNQIKDIEERLISRMVWGMTVDIQPPNWEMRVAILKKKLEEDNIDITDEIVHFVASNVKDNVRYLEGCLAGMIMESTISGGEITLEIAERVLKRVVGNIHKSKNITVDIIISEVAKYYNTSENNILSRKRTKEIAFARQVAMYLTKEMTNLTLETIGLNFGGKDHATVLYACKTIKDLTKQNNSLSKSIEEIKENIKNQ
jgi:chromosomal replication initiator protein